MAGRINHPLRERTNQIMDLQQQSDGLVGDQGMSLATTQFGPTAPKQLSSQLSAKKLLQKRAEKIHEHLAVTVHSPDTLQACMGPIACDLMEMCATMKAAISEGFQGTPSVARLEELMPLIQVYLKLVRQVDRLARLDCRIQARPPAQDTQSQKQLFSQIINRSEDSAI